MQSVFLVCAIAGSAILVIQFLMTLIGFDGDESGLDSMAGGEASLGDTSLGDDVASGHDGLDHDPNSLFKKITFRSVVAATAFFGIAGMAASSAGLSPFPTMAIAVAAGGGALYAVGWLFHSLRHLSEEGNLQISQAVGRPGTVYIPIPGEKSGAGKIQLNLQNRIVELRAVTSEKDRLPTGASVVVVEVVSSNTVAVELAREAAKT